MRRTPASDAARSDAGQVSGSARLLESVAAASASYFSEQLRISQEQIGNPFADRLEQLRREVEVLKQFSGVPQKPEAFGGYVPGVSASTDEKKAVHSKASKRKAK